MIQLEVKKEKRVITVDRCVDLPVDNVEALILDWKRARFIIKKKFRVIAGSRRLGQLWLVLDPLIISMIYLFVFTVIRYQPDPRSLFIGITYVRILQLGLRNGFNNSVDYTGGIIIERVRTRALLFSEYMLIVTNTFFMCFGVCLLFLLFYDSSLLDVIIIFLGALVMYLMWYGIGAFFSPLGTKIPDLKQLVSYLGMMMFFASPALYSLGQTKGIHRTVSMYNPFSYIVEITRNVVLDSNDLYLLNYNLGVFYMILFLTFITFSIIRFDYNRWRYSTWN